MGGFMTAAGSAAGNAIGGALVTSVAGPAMGLAGPMSGPSPAIAAKAGAETAAQWVGWAPWVGFGVGLVGGLVLWGRRAPARASSSPSTGGRMEQ